MRWTKTFIPTLREAPSDAESPSHKLMVRAGLIRQLAAGSYSYLPLGYRALRKAEQIVREEMDRAGAVELLMPALHPAELWQETGRFDVMGDTLMKLKDRKGALNVLGPTHEEVITHLVRNEVKSYRQLPITLYQIQGKFRDEARPRHGIIRTREFIMKDAYSFDVNEAGGDKSYEKMYRAYRRIFERCGLNFRAVEADTGSIGGTSSHEFMVLADSGEDAIVSCSACEYAANMEKAEAKKGASCEHADPRPLEHVSTPGQKSIEDVAKFLGVNTTQIVKTLVLLADGEPVVALLRGDYDLNEIKLKNYLGCNDIEMAGDEVVVKVTGAPVGYAGPVGLQGKVKVIADLSVQCLRNFVTGANAGDTHLKNVNLDRDFTVTEFVDIRNVVVGDGCPRCESGSLEIWRGIEVGHVFKLGYKYSKALNASYLDADGKEQIIFMGCYGIGIGRTVAACIEQNHDDNGIIFPIPIAPFHCIISELGGAKDEAVRKASEEIYEQLLAAGVEVLLDDRDERPGFKFKDADLIGIPLRIVVGAKSLAEGKVELKERKSGNVEILPIAEAVAKVNAAVKQALQA
ncbi:MAG TPA: proline--tRNA ligase [Geomonas sp.]|nr:proline--tRNA ligase [Geomonas sp.]